MAKVLRHCVQMKRRYWRECTPILPWPTWPLAGHARFGQNIVVGSMIVLLSWLAGERATKEYVWIPILVTSELHHGCVGSYPALSYRPAPALSQPFAPSRSHHACCHTAHS